MLSEPILKCPHYLKTDEFVNCQPCEIQIEHAAGECCKVHCVKCANCQRKDAERRSTTS